jgi:hypothetical protein
MQQLSALTLFGFLTLVCAGCGDSPQEPGKQGTAAIPAQEILRSTHAGNGGITVPTTGSSDDGGTFRGVLTITGADFNPQLGPVLLVRIHGALVPGSGGSGDEEPTEGINLEFGPIEFSYAGQQADTDEDCIELQLRPPPLFHPETKTTVHFDVSTVTTRTLPGPANIIADLICANDRIAEYGWEPDQPPQ